jgi:hypothetical protein
VWRRARYPRLPVQGLDWIRACRHHQYRAATGALAPPKRQFDIEQTLSKSWWMLSIRSAKSILMGLPAADAPHSSMHHLRLAPKSK